MVLGISEGNWVLIGVGCIPFFVAAFLRYKTRADKAEIMGDVKKEISEELEPIKDRLGQHETDFKDYKREVIEPMRETINQLVTKQSVIDVKVDTIIDGIGDLKKLIGKIFDELNNKKDK